MSDEENADAAMAECGACRAIIPLESESCPECKIRFGGVSDEALGECEHVVHCNQLMQQNVRIVM